MTDRPRSGKVPARAEELRLLRQSALPFVAVPASFIGWIWLILALNSMDLNLDLLIAVPPLSLFLFGSLALLLNQLSNESAASLLLVGLATACFSGSYLGFDGLAPYLFVMVVSVSSILLRPLAGLLIAVPLSGMIWLAGRYGLDGPQPLAHVLRPIALLWLTALVSYLSSRSIYLAVTWAWENANLARQHAGEVLDRQEELNRALHSLDNMYALLARARSEEAMAREEAEEGRRQKAQFAANISHELRTPLNLIIGFSELMYAAPEIYGDFKWPAALRSDVREVYRNSEHLRSLIDDILDLSQLEEMRMPLIEEETLIGDLIRDTVATASGLVRGKDVRLETAIQPDLPILWIDRTRIRQTLLNLLSNACRFTERGKIAVSAHTEDGAVHIQVADTGIGMTPKELDRAFAAFEQADATIRRRYGGTGLGLALSRRFVELHGGRIWAESTPGHGSTFHFTLPTPESERVLISRSVRGPSSEYASRDGTRAKTVVMQVSEPSAARLFGRYVHDYRFIASESPAHTLQLVEREHPWAVILDASTANEPGRSEGRIEASVPILRYRFDLPDAPQRFPNTVRWMSKPVGRQQLLATLAALAPTARDILVVDDDPGDVQLLTEMMRSAENEYHVSGASGGAEALEAIAAKLPDALILDLIMPGIGGLEVLKRLGQNPRTVDLPVLVVTAGDISSGTMPSHAPRVDALTIAKRGGLTTREWLSCTKAILDTVTPRYVGDSDSARSRPATRAD